MNAQTTASNSFPGALRRVLCLIASGTNHIFDGDAGHRLLGIGVDPGGFIGSRDDGTFELPGSAGAIVENSIAMSAALRAEAFTRTGEWASTSDELHALWQALLPFKDVLQSHLSNATGNSVFFTNEDDVDEIMVVLNAVDARTRLYQREPLSFPDLAALSGLSEKTVRMAATGRDRNPDLKTYKDGNATLIAPEEADRWLQTRATFKPTRILNVPTGLHLAPKTTLELGALLTELLARSGKPLIQVIEEAGLPAAIESNIRALQTDFWNARDLDYSLLDIATLTRLARGLEVSDVPTFVQAVAAVLVPYQIDYELAKSNANASTQS